MTRSTPLRLFDFARLRLAARPSALLSALVATLLVACSSVRTTYDYDPSADFSACHCACMAFAFSLRSASSCGHEAWAIE